MLRRNGFLPVALLAPLALMAALPVQAAINHLVPHDFATISAAMAAASDGDTISVSAGIYPESVDFNGKAVLLKGVDPNFAAIIRPPAGVRAVIFNHGEDNGSAMGGFAIQASTNAGAGILVQNASPLIAGNIITGATGTNGPALLVDGQLGSTVAIIADNQFLSSDCQGTNTANAAVNIVNASSVEFFNNLITGSNCNGLYVNTSGTAVPQILNNTIASTLIGIDLAAASNPNQTFRNNITASNQVGAKLESGTTFLWQNNLAFNNSTANYQGFSADPTGTNGNINTNPQFADAAGGNYQLLSTSTAIDAGSTAALPAGDVADLSNHTRLRDGDSNGTTVVDIGAYEFQPVVSGGNFSGGSAMPLLTVLALAGVGFARRRKKA